MNYREPGLKCIQPFHEVPVDHVISSIKAVVARHDALRYCFRQQGALLEAQLNDPILFDPEVIDCRSTSNGMQEGLTDPALQRVLSIGISLRDIWLLRAYILVTADRSGPVAMVFHHLISDTTSVSIIRQELSVLLTQKPSDNWLRRLPSPVVQFSEFARWEMSWFQGDRAETLARY